MEFTKESLMNEYIFEAACNKLDPEGMGIQLDRTEQTIGALVLDYFFEKKGDDTYSLKPKFLEEYTESILEGDLQPKTRTNWMNRSTSSYLKSGWRKTNSPHRSHWSIWSHFSLHTFF